MALYGNTALVTGTGSQGIGSSIALALADEGADIALHWFRNQVAAERLADEIRKRGRKAYSFGANLSEPAIARDLVHKACAALGGLSIAVCNAAMIVRKPFLDVTDEDWAKVHSTNLHGTFAVAQESAKVMVAAGQGGRIVLISSISQVHANPDISPYVASKGGILMLGRAMALELAKYDITVNLVAPGTIETDINRHMLADPAFRARKLAGVPLRRAGTPDDVAGAVSYLASKQAAYVTGTTVTVDGGLSIATEIPQPKRH